MTTPEQLKAIAEAQGLSVQSVGNEVWLHKASLTGKALRLHCNGTKPYNPTTNRAQLDELLKWLGLRGWVIYYEKDTKEWSMFTLEANGLNHKDRTTAILMAACKEVEV